MTVLIDHGRRMSGASTPEMREHQQSLTPGARLELYKIDFNPIGVATELFLTPHALKGGDPISFGGQVYTQAPLYISEIEKTISGEQPEPKLFLPNVDKFASSLVRQYRDLVGVEVIRTTTFEDFLDGGEMEDPAARLGYEIFVVEQKLNLNPIWGEFALRVLADTANRTVPGRSAYKDMCGWRYRYYDTETEEFVVSDVRPCPYAGTAFFKEDGTPTENPAEDLCAGDIDGCTARYGSGTKPFGGFPGMGRYRIS